MKRDHSISFDIIWQACIGCSACVAVCPQPEPFVSPHDTIALNTACQIACMRCVEVCPTSAITFEQLLDSAGLVAKSLPPTILNP